MSSVDSHYLLNSLYNIEFKLFDHFDPQKKKAEPLAVIRAFPEEDPQADSLFEDVVYRYASNKIGERFRMSLEEYLRLPCTKARCLDKVAEIVMGPIEKEEVDKRKAMLDGLNGKPPK